jgi:hypothetical protein
MDDKIYFKTLTDANRYAAKLRMMIARIIKRINLKRLSFLKLSLKRWKIAISDFSAGNLTANHFDDDAIDIEVDSSILSPHQQQDLARSMFIQYSSMDASHKESFDVLTMPLGTKREDVIYDIEDISICTPESKLHKNGHGWIDITSKQILLLKKAKYSILAFRLEGNKVYYVNFSDLEKYLTQEYIFNNNREGNHWKLYIWPKHIEIRGNAKHLLVEPNKLSNFII